MLPILDFETELDFAPVVNRDGPLIPILPYLTSEIRNNLYLGSEFIITFDQSLLSRFTWQNARLVPGLFLAYVLSYCNVPLVNYPYQT